jgi:SAM-dependent methyltransferase
VGHGKRVLIFSREAAALAQALEARGCRTVTGAVAVEGRRASLDLDPERRTDPGRREPCEGEDGPGDGRFDAIVVADLLGRVDDPRSVLRSLKERIRPGGSLIVVLGGIASCGDRLAIVDGGPLGAGSGLLFTEEGLFGILEDAEYVIGHVERDEPAAGAGEPGPPVDPAIQDCLIVAHPLPVPGLEFLQRRMRDLVEQAQDAAREAAELRRHAAVADRRLEILTGHENRMAERIKGLRTRLLEAHAEMIRRDDEIRNTFGDALFERNALLIERDDLIGRRDALVDERSVLIAERDALESSLRSAMLRLNLFRSSPLGLAYRAIRKLVPRRWGRGGPGR